MTQGPSPETFFAELHAQTGGRLFTVTVIDREAGLARRVYTSHPETYPVSGTKPMGQGAWTEQVVERGEVFIANTVAEFAIYFPDHAVIEGLGCAAAMNVPILDENVVGTVNILDKENHFTPAVVEACLAAISHRKNELVQILDSCDFF